MENFKRALQARIGWATQERSRLSALEKRTSETVDHYYNQLIDLLEGARLEDQDRLVEIHREVLSPHIQSAFQLNAYERELQKMHRRTEQSTVRAEEIAEMAAALEHVPSFEPQLFSENSMRAQLNEFREHVLERTRFVRVPRSQGVAANSALRFSFEQALSQKALKRHRFEAVMNPLKEEENEEADPDAPSSGSSQDAFRNLFPEDEDLLEMSDRDCKQAINSPVFKQI